MSLLRWLAAVSLLLGTVIAASFTTVDDDHDVLITNLLSWLRDNGAYINDAVVVRHVNQNDASTPRGLFATKTIEEGETIATIPWNLIIKSKDKTGEPGWSETDCGIIDATIEAMSGDNITPYGHYLLAQPRGYTPGFWGKEATELLEEMLNDRLPPNDFDDMLDYEWKKMCRGDVNNPLHVHAVMLVRARSDWDLLVPFYDMTNHHNGKTNIQHKYNPYVESIKETGHSLIASKRIEVGEELYNSYNHCKNVCDQYLDHFGTPEMFLHFGFVEFLPQRWLFDFARVKFDLVQDEEDKVSVNFLVPPSERGMAMLREELDRLESFASKRRGMDYKEANITETEWTLLWQYFDALRDALSFAIKSDEALVDDVWKLDDDWWVRDGTIKATDDEHWIRPTPRDGDEEL